MYLRPFDPWKSEFCTCPPKYSLNPYTGCSHGCIYCYASSFIKDFFKCREKSNLIYRLKREIEKIPTESLISLSNTSDPYPPIEVEKSITRECLKIFKDNNMRVLIITKSPLVCRDLDLLKEIPTAVTMTITTLRHFRILEPNAPSPFERLKALEVLSREGIKTGLRFDPIIPLINEEETERILREAKSAGISHVTASTFKPRWDSWNRVISNFPKIRTKLETLYLKKGQKYNNILYLNTETRRKILNNIKEICDQMHLKFSTCRENLNEYKSSESCDGSHLIKGGK